MRITSKGQVTIPEAMRREAGLLPGTEVDFAIEDGRVVMTPRRKGRSKREAEVLDHLDKWRGTVRGWSTEEVMRLTRGED